MVLKAIKNSLKKNCQKKFYEKKTNSDKKKFQKFSEVPKFRHFPKVMCKTMFVMFRTHLVHWHLHLMQHLAQCNNCCYITKYHSCNLGYNYICTVSHMVGYCLYGTLLLRPRWTACPVQIRAHHRIDVYTDINNRYCSFIVVNSYPQ